jgi:hypothetical protein
MPVSDDESRGGIWQMNTRAFRGGPARARSGAGAGGGVGWRGGLTADGAEDFLLEVAEAGVHAAEVVQHAQEDLDRRIIGARRVLAVRAVLPGDQEMTKIFDDLWKYFIDPICP